MKYTDIKVTPLNEIPAVLTRQATPRLQVAGELVQNFATSGAKVWQVDLPDKEFPTKKDQDSFMNTMRGRITTLKLEGILVRSRGGHLFLVDNRKQGEELEEEDE